MIRFVKQFFTLAFLLILFGSASDCSKKQQPANRTASGYLFVHHIKNEGKKPEVGDELTYHQIVLKNDTLLQSTYYQSEPRTTIMPPRDSVASPPPPHYEALLMMAPGDSMTVYQMLDTFPAASLPPGVTNKDTFIYHLKLFSIKPRKEVEIEQAKLAKRTTDIIDSMQVTIKDYLAGKLDEQIITTESGLKFIIHSPGTGKTAEPGKFIDVDYAGFLTDGTNFDNTWKKQRPYTFRVGRGLVIAGWDEALPKLKEGGKATLFIPYTLAYGEAGNPPQIPERADLIFYVELKKVRF